VREAKGHILLNCTEKSVNFQKDLINVADIIQIIIFGNIFDAE
jgi:hypothetical protein